MSSGRWIVSKGYGRCLEGIREAEAGYWAAHARMVEALKRGDEAAAGREQIEMAACLKDRADWAEVARCAPRFVEASA